MLFTRRIIIVIRMHADLTRVYIQTILAFFRETAETKGKQLHFISCSYVELKA